MFESLKSVSRHHYDLHMHALTEGVLKGEQICNICAGSDCPVLCHEALADVVKGYEWGHLFSAEWDVPKNELLQELCTHCVHFFLDAVELSTG